MLGRERYYEDEGRAHDYLMRCKDCQKLVTFVAIQKLGCCDGCGNKRFTEVTLMEDRQMLDIQSGLIDFTDHDAMTAEFVATCEKCHSSMSVVGGGLPLHVWAKDPTQTRREYQCECGIIETIVKADSGWFVEKGAAS